MGKENFFMEQSLCVEIVDSFYRVVKHSLLRTLLLQQQDYAMQYCAYFDTAKEFS